MPNSPFKHRIVRDLAWVIASPPLVSGYKKNVNWLNHEICLQEYRDCLPTLETLDIDPSPLISHIDSLKSKRLGYRFEAFINYWLQISPNFELIDHNIQIIENKKTRGEIDFIIQDVRTNKIIHLEVAVKFYLGSPPFEDRFRWFGTNTQDQLGKKQQHLEQHQTQLSLRYPDHLTHKIDLRYCLLKGRLFYPFDSKGIKTSPSIASKNHLTGHWIKQSDVQNEPSLEGLLLYPLHKHEWLSPLLPEDIKNKTALTEIELNAIDRAQCCIAVKRGDFDHLLEVSRLFVLPDSFQFPEIT